MKALLRHPSVQRVLAAVAAAYLRFAFRTIRWRREGWERVEAEKPNGVILCFWHAGISVSALTWPQHRPGVPEMRALISRSRDGAMFADVIARLGVPSIRGSRAVEVDRTREKGGMEALREMARWVKSGGAVAITPDGPRGPARTMGEGPALLARLTGAPVFMMGLACRPVIRLNSWDKALAPLPFSRGAVVYEGPYRADAESPSGLSEPWRAALDRATERAEALVQ